MNQPDAMNHRQVLESLRRRGVRRADDLHRAAGRPVRGAPGGGVRGQGRPRRGGSVHTGRTPVRRLGRTATGPTGPLARPGGSV